MPETDLVAAEEPLEIRLHGRPFAVIMRTPGADRELAAGFLLSERVIQSADDLGTIEHCANPDGPAEAGRHEEPEAAERIQYVGSALRRTKGDGAANVVNVTLIGDAANAIDRVLGERRNVTTNSSCGLCGRQTLESLAVDVPSIP